MRQIVSALGVDFVNVGAHLVAVDSALWTPVFVEVLLVLPFYLAGDLSRGVDIEMPRAIWSWNIGELDVDGSRRMRHG